MTAKASYKVHRDNKGKKDKPYLPHGRPRESKKIQITLVCILLQVIDKKTQSSSVNQQVILVSEDCWFKPHWVLNEAYKANLVTKLLVNSSRLPEDCQFEPHQSLNQNFRPNLVARLLVESSRLPVPQKDFLFFSLLFMYV